MCTNQNRKKKLNKINDYSFYIVSGTGLLSIKLGVAISEPGLITCEQVKESHKGLEKATHNAKVDTFIAATA